MALPSLSFASQITVPAIGLHSSVGNVLDNGPMWVWHSRPGDGRTLWIAGHRTTHSHPFYSIDKLKKGDKIYVKDGGKAFRYVVTASRVVPASYRYVPRQTESLMLSACARWDGTPTSANYRIVVFAKLDALSAK